MPADVRRVWIETIVGGYASLHPNDVIAWIEQFRGDPEYDAALGAVARRLATTDVAAAVSLVEANALWGDQMLVTSIAAGWGSADPAVGASWALGIPDRQSRQRAIATVAGAWLREDPLAAEQWVMSLPSGETRDFALDAMVAGVFQADPAMAGRLFAAFDSASARETAAFLIATRIMREDEAEARRLLNQYVTNPDAHAQFERYLGPRSPDAPNCGAFRTVC